jgi:predicted GIY-YIG superfamily endonuclease
MPDHGCVYRAYNDADELLYVGVTGNLPERIKGHRSERSWWRVEVARVESDGVLPWAEALASERAQIAALRPRHNQRQVFHDESVQFTVRLSRSLRDRVRAKAALEHRTTAQVIRLLVDDYLAGSISPCEIADHEKPVAA